jgi:hypothetical protein
MGMILYENDKDRAVHLSTIHEIAHACGRSEDEVARVYEAELSKLKLMARVKDFLPVLARRVVLESLRHSAQT